MASEFLLNVLGLTPSSGDSIARLEAPIESIWPLSNELFENCMHDNDSTSSDSTENLSTTDDDDDDNEGTTNNNSKPAHKLEDASRCLARVQLESKLEPRVNQSCVLVTNKVSKSPGSMRSKGSTLQGGTNDNDDDDDAARQELAPSTEQLAAGADAATVAAAAATQQEKSTDDEDDEVDRIVKKYQVTRENSRSHVHQAEVSQAAGRKATKTTCAQHLHRIYCHAINIFLWLTAARFLLGKLLLLLQLDKTFPLALDLYAPELATLLVPLFCIALHAAAVSTLFISNRDKHNWRVPFCTHIRFKSLMHESIEDKTRANSSKRRLSISTRLALICAFVCAILLANYLIYRAASKSEIDQIGMTTATAKTSKAAATTASSKKAHKFTTLYATSKTKTAKKVSLSLHEPPPPPPPPPSKAGGINSQNNNTDSASISSKYLNSQVIAQAALRICLTLDAIWIVYVISAGLFVPAYFSYICHFMKSRFLEVKKNVKARAEKKDAKRETISSARELTCFYLEHNEACELVAESNTFWKYMINYTYLMLTPTFFYCAAYLIFGRHLKAWQYIVALIMLLYTGTNLLLISISAADLSTEAHAPQALLHKLMLNQLPTEYKVEMGIAFRKIRDIFIGYSCHNLFHLTYDIKLNKDAARAALYCREAAHISRLAVLECFQEILDNESPTPSEV